MGGFFPESDCSWDDGCAWLCSSLGSPSVTHARPLREVYFFKDFLLVKGRNPFWHVFLAPSFFWFSVRAVLKSPCQVRGVGVFRILGGSCPPALRWEKHPCLPAHSSPCLQPLPQDVRACAPKLVFSPILK